MPDFSGPSSCSQQWVPGDLSEWLLIGKAFVRFALSSPLDSTSYLKESWARCCFHVILGVFLFKSFVPSSFGPAESWIHIILYRRTVQASCLVRQKITHCLFNHFNGNFLKSKLTPTLFKFIPIFTFSGERKMRAVTKQESCSDCRAELMFGISIPYIVFSSNWEMECLNTALITKGGSPLVDVCFPKCSCGDPLF